MQARGRVAPYLIVIDDEAGIREFVGRVAEQAGFVVEMAATGRDLILMLGKIVPAVIVLDLNMADTDGIEVLRDLAGRHLPTKIIIFSGSDIRVLESSPMPSCKSRSARPSSWLFCVNSIWRMSHFHRRLCGRT